MYNTQEHFIDCLRSRKPFETDVQHYLNNIIVQDAIYKSNEEGTPVKP